MTDGGGNIKQQMSPYLGAKLPSWDTHQPGEPSKHKHGVLYQGPWEVLYDGFNEHVRRCARAMAMSDTPVKLRSFRPQRLRPDPLEKRDLINELKEVLDTTIRTYDAHINQVVSSEGIFQRLAMNQHFGGDQLKYINSLKVVSSVFERMSLQEHEIEALKAVGQVWVACHANADMLVDAGVPEVRVVPVPYFDDDPLLKLEGRKRQPGPVRFYHIGKWEPRKEGHKMLGAFLRAFKPGEASLMYKTSPSAPSFEDYPSGPMESLRTWLKDSTVQVNGWNTKNVLRSVFLITEYVTSKRLRELHRIGDIYLSLSHGEGFDMPAFDAKLAGNLMVYTPSGGPQDFAGEYDQCVNDDGEIDCHPFYNWKGCVYLGYAVTEAAIKMRRAFETVKGGVRERGRSLENFRAETVGRNMSQFVKQVYENRFVPNADE
jgi:hypothetical protein